MSEQTGLGKGAMIGLMAGTLVAAGGARWLVQKARQSATPQVAATAAVTQQGTEIGQLDSFALGLLLGGLRGPLVMALWANVEQQRVDRELDNIDTQMELIRLLQPQFDSVHIQQIANKAYNLSVEFANPAGRYAAVLDALAYARRVSEQRPGDIDIETQLGNLFVRKLGSGEDREYFSRRIHVETQATQPVVRIEFPGIVEQELRDAAAKAGISPRALIVRDADTPGRRVALVQQEFAAAIEGAMASEDVTLSQLPPPEEADAVGRPQRMRSMLQPDGTLLAELTQARRGGSQGVVEGEYLTGAPIQFLDELGPFPEGISPLALGYEHFRRAQVLMRHAGQMPLEASAGSVDADPGRALRDWSIEAFEIGRQIEAEAYNRAPPARSLDGERQAELETVTADAPLDGDVFSPALLRRAMQRYERSIQVGERAATWLEAHIAENPGALNIFEASIDRIEFTNTLLEADLLYARLLLDEVPAAERAEAIAQAERLYRQAYAQALDFVTYFYGADALPPEINARSAAKLPTAVKEQVYRDLQAQRDRLGLVYDHARLVNEFDGFRQRIVVRIRQLDAAAAR